MNAFHVIGVAAGTVVDVESAPNAGTEKRSATTIAAHM
jgi:hypothetical protein